MQYIYSKAELSPLVTIVLASARELTIMWLNYTFTATNDLLNPGQNKMRFQCGLSSEMILGTLRFNHKLDSIFTAADWRWTTAGSSSASLAIPEAILWLIEARGSPENTYTSWIKSLTVINICNTACQSPAEVSQVPLSCQHNEQATTCSSTTIVFIICVQQLRHQSNWPSSPCSQLQHEDHNPRAN